MNIWHKIKTDVLITMLKSLKHSNVETPEQNTYSSTVHQNHECTQKFTQEMHAHYSNNFYIAS